MGLEIKLAEWTRRETVRLDDGKLIGLSDAVLFNPECPGGQEYAIG